jgi:predicted nucleic acid-binding Zn finger protein
MSKTGVDTLVEVKHWTQWPTDLHNEPEQIKRQISANKTKHQPLEVDVTTQTGTFAGSGKKPYITTLSKCNCNDFVKRKLPCKHMYSLANYLGHIELYNPDFEYDESIVLLRAYAPTNDWGTWNPGIHKIGSQKARYHRAFEEEFDINNFSPERLNAVINGYAVFLDSCSCPDFQDRQFPCKHIYRLAAELGLVEKLEISPQKYEVTESDVMFTIKIKL